MKTIDDVQECCDHCDDSNGVCVFPYYGPAPHSHDAFNGMFSITRAKPKDQWGDNFREDLDCEGFGVYMRCPHCGRGEPVLSPNDELRSEE